MRILIHGLNFAPELTGIGKYTGELASFLAAQGHLVHAVTTPPYYPQWRISPGYSGWVYRTEQWQGVSITRCPLWVPRKPSGIKRVLYLASFALTSFPVLINEVRWKPEIWINIVPAIASAPFSLTAARLAGSKTWLHVQDFELDAAVKLKMLPKSSFILRLTQRIESACLRRFDRVSTISQRMLEHLWQKGVPPGKTVLLPNWVDVKTIYPSSQPSPLRDLLGLGSDECLVLYAGNMGEKQGLEVLIKAACMLQNENKITFVLCGEGAVLDLLVEKAKGLPNVRFLPLQPIEKLNDLLNAADIHVLLQRANAADLVMPSKLSGMLASGRPVIAAARPGTELFQIVSQVGVTVPPEDVEALVKAILELQKNHAKRAQLGLRGPKFIEQNWEKERVLANFLKEIRAI
jgi:colanic acid biosynthesis glycosyl transferase WcaI